MRVFKLGDPIPECWTCSPGDWFVYFVDDKGKTQYVARCVDEESAKKSYEWYKLDYEKVEMHKGER